MKKLFILTMIFQCIMGREIFAQSLNVKGKIHTNDSLMILFGDGIEIDTLMSTNGDFYFQRDMKHPELVTIVAIKTKSNEYVKKDFFIGEGEVHFNSKFDEVNSTNVEMTDRKAQIKYNEFKSRFNPLVKMARSVIDSSYVEGKTDVEQKIYKKLYDRIVDIQKEVAKEFVFENTDNIVGAFILANHLQGIDNKEIENIINLFDHDLLNSKYLTKVNDRLKMEAHLEEGLIAPDFNLKSENGQQINAKDLLGKHTVLDFWGSWCAPCIAGMPKMKEYFQKYGDKINFIGIACKDEEVNWRSAIIENQLSWSQYLNSSQKEDLTHKFQINAFPTKIIIDPDGNILKIFIGETEDFYNHIDQIFSNII
jgi:thiol-disulfide isomerase/thioredoxin